MNLVVNLVFIRLLVPMALVFLVDLDMVSSRLLHGFYTANFTLDYAFINQSTVDIFVSQGVNTFRVAFLLERMCPTQYGLGRKFNETYYNYFEQAINYITDVKGECSHLTSWQFPWLTLIQVLTPSSTLTTTIATIIRRNNLAVAA
jgi:hypothetical protein